MKLLLALASAFASAYCSTELSQLSDFAEELGVEFPTSPTEFDLLKALAHFDVVVDKDDLKKYFTGFNEDVVAALVNPNEDLDIASLVEKHKDKFTEAVSVLETSFNDFNEYSKNFDFTKAQTTKSKETENTKIRLLERKYDLVAALIYWKINGKVDLQKFQENLNQFKAQIQNIPITTTDDFAKELGVLVPTPTTQEELNVYFEAFAREIASASDLCINKYENLLTEIVYDSDIGLKILEAQISEAEESSTPFSAHEKARIEENIFLLEKLLTTIRTRLPGVNSEIFAKLRDLINRVKNLTLVNLSIRPHIL